MLAEIGNACALITLFILIVVRAIGKPPGTKKYYRKMFVRAITLYLLSLLVLITSTHTILSIKYRNDPKMVELWDKANKNHSDTSAKKEFDEYRNRGYK